VTESIFQSGDTPILRRGERRGGGIHCTEVAERALRWCWWQVSGLPTLLFLLQSRGTSVACNSHIKLLELTKIVKWLPHQKDRLARW